MLVSVLFLSSMVMAVGSVPSSGGSSCIEEISFVGDSVDDFVGVDNPSAFSTNDGTNNLGTITLSLLDGKGDVTGYYKGSQDDLTQRGTRGLGVYPGERDEIEDEEKAVFSFDDSYYIRYVEVRSLYSGECGERGKIKYKKGSNVAGSEVMIGTSNGVWSKSYNSGEILLDEIKFYVSGAREECSEFAVAKIQLQRQDCDAPECSVDFFGQHALEDAITYINSEGDYTVKGAASDSGSGLNYDTLQANRSSDDEDSVRTWNFGDVDLGVHDQNNAFWAKDYSYSSSRYNYYYEGNHTMCCEVDDEVGNHFEGACKTVCIDSEAPVMGKLGLRFGGDCDGTDEMYIDGVSNSLSVTPWKAYDIGCAGIDYYVVEVYLDGVLIETFNQTGVATHHPNPADGVYYFVIWAVDKAGNVGDSVMSANITVDNTDPEVTITSPEDDAWFNTNFNLTETDSDTNLLGCAYQVDDLGWNNITCNEVLPIDISGLVDGEHTLAKKAKDKACNEYSTSIDVNIDTTAPITTKEVGERKYSGAKGWMGWVLDWFITDKTDLTFTCDDGAGKGCDITYFTIYNATGAIVREGNSTTWAFKVTMDLPDGVYNVTYYSVDQLGNTEELQWEIDKVDSEAPVTVRTVNPYYDDGETKWISCESKESYECTDSEVGCNYTENGSRCAQDGFDASTFCLFNCDPKPEPKCETFEYFWHSVDLLGNIETEKTEINGLDCEGPEIKIHLPSWSEGKWSVDRCDQSIVVEVWDDKSGVDESSVYAELYLEGSQTPVRTIPLGKAVYKGEDGAIYEGIMDLQLAPGEYDLKIFASDNIGNEGTKTRKEILEAGIYVEHIDASCILDMEIGGTCDFELNVCMRGDNDVQMWMDTLVDDPRLITPQNLSAEISNSYDPEDAYVGLAQIPGLFTPVNKISDAETLMLDGDEINGKTAFNLSLTITPEIAGMIGIGSYDLEYYLESPNAP